MSSNSEERKEAVLDSLFEYAFKEAELTAQIETLIGHYDYINATLNVLMLRRLSAQLLEIRVAGIEMLAWLVSHAKQEVES